MQIQKDSTLDMWDSFLWRPVMRKRASWWEVKEHWTMDDLVTYHELQDMEDAYTEEANKPKE